MTNKQNQKEDFNMDKINEYLQRTLNIVPGGLFSDICQAIRPRIECADGFAISVQASEFHYCSPRISGNVIYEKVELGFPNQVEPLIMIYAEDPDIPTETVYGWVPVEIVNSIIEKHGGIVN